MTSEYADQRERDAFYDGAHEMDPLRDEPTVERADVFPPSSNVKSCGWAAWAIEHECHLVPGIPCGVLDVEFTDGAVCRYYHVPKEVAEKMQGKYGSPCTSVGAYFHVAVRKHSHGGLFLVEIVGREPHR